MTVSSPIFSESKIVLGVLILAALGLSACGTGSNTPAFNYTPGSATALPAGPTDDPNAVVARVNGAPITMDTFQKELARFEAGRAALGMTIADENAYKQQILNTLIDDELLRQKAAAENITVTDQEVDTVINDMITETGQDYFNSWLQSNYYTLEEFREVIRMQLLVNKLREPIIANVPQSTEQVHARHILVNSEAQAQEVLARLNNGEDFGVLAKEYSVDVTTRDNNGDLGWFPRGGLLVPEVEESAFSLQPGQTSGIVTSAWGYHIIQTLEFDPNRAIDEETRQRLINRVMDDWRKSLRDGANIEQLIILSS